MAHNLIQILTAGIGSAGFAVLFNIHGRRLGLIGIGGALAWAFYLHVGHQMDSTIIALFAAANLATVLAEISARLIKTPVITLLAPMLIPLLPGGDLYYAMSSLAQNDMAAFASSSQFVLKEACALAFGILVITSLTQIIMKTWHYARSFSQKL